MNPTDALKKNFDAEGTHADFSTNPASIDKTYRPILRSSTYKTKQVVEVDRTNLLSRFATGKFSNKKVVL
jgi:hypothetical protein